MRKLVTLLLLTILVLPSMAKVRAVIITGQNNHNWPVSSVALERILTNSGEFDVDIARSPAAGGDMSAFNVDFSKYQLAVLDYNGDSWNEGMKKAFLDYVQNGGGVIVYHAADNAFSSWKEFNEIIALGGWEGRNEKSGPYVYLKEGKLFRDYTTGPGGNHGRQHEYTMNCRCNHPVLRGLPAKWKHAQDELYEKMRGPGNIKDLLYSAYARPDMSGSGREEPLVFTVDYGKARIFHIMIGHAGETLENNPAMQCAGFQTILLRGCQWAARQKVDKKCPSDFPTENQTSFRKDYKCPSTL